MNHLRIRKDFLNSFQMTTGLRVRNSVYLSPVVQSTINPIALRKAKIVYNFGLPGCNRVNFTKWLGKNLLSITVFTKSNLLIFIAEKIPGAFVIFFRQ